MQSQQTRTINSPASPRMNPRQYGAGGTLGGLGSWFSRGLHGGGGGMHMAGDAFYLWVLVALEVGAMAWLRHAFRRQHGG